MGGYSEAFMQAAQLAQANSSQRYVDLSNRSAVADLPSEEFWKLYENYTKALKELAAVQDSNETAKRSLADAMAQRESSMRSRPYLTTDHRTVGMVNKEKLDIANEAKEANSAALAKLRDDWDDVMHKVHQLQAEADASQVLVSSVCSERDELRGMLDKKQTEIKAEDQNSVNEMQMLLAEFQKSGVGLDATQKSPQQFVEQFAELTERTTERLAKRAEVSQRLSLYPDLIEFVAVKNLDESRPFHPIAYLPANPAPKQDKPARFPRLFRRHH